VIPDNLKYPDINVVISVLTKIGVDPQTRNLDCQDYECTTCDLSELEKYIELYVDVNTSVYEKRVLGCYILEGLNDFVSAVNKPHLLQDRAFEYLYGDYQIHQPEIEYRLDSEGRTEDECWPIAKYMLEWVQKRGTGN